MYEILIISVVISRQWLVVVTLYLLIIIYLEKHNRESHHSPLVSPLNSYSFMHSVAYLVVVMIYFGHRFYCDERHINSAVKISQLYVRSLLSIISAAFLDAVFFFSLSKQIMILNIIYVL